MIVYQKRIEYKKKSTSEGVLDKLLAKNLSKRFQSSKNDKKKLLDKGVEQCPDQPFYSNSVKDIPKCQCLECEKCSTVTVDPLRNENRNDWKLDIFNSQNSFEKTEFFYEDRVDQNVRKISKMLTRNCKAFCSRLSKYNQNTSNDFNSNESHWNKFYGKKKPPQLKKVPMEKNSQITNIRNLLSTITDVSDLQLITKTTLNSHHNILNTIRLPNLLRIKKHSRKFKLPTSTNILGVNSSEAVNKKTPHFRQNVAVHMENFNSNQQLTDLGISNLLGKKENPESSIENLMNNLPISRNRLSVAESMLPPLCFKYNSEINSILNGNNGNTDCENKVINLGWVERNFIFNPTNVNLLKIKLLKNCFNPSVFYSEPVEVIECMSESYTLIDLWSQSPPGLESFITKKLLYKKDKELSTGNRLNKIHKFGRKAVVILEHIPLIEKIVNSGMKCTCCEFSNLEKKPRRKNKILVLHKQNTTMQKFRKKKKLCDKIENTNEILSSKYPIVSLPRVDISLFKSKRRMNKQEQITGKKDFVNHTCSNKCKCFQSNPVVVLIKLDALLMFDNIRQNSLNVKSEEDIIDLTDV